MSQFYKGFRTGDRVRIIDYSTDDVPEGLLGATGTVIDFIPSDPDFCIKVKLDVPLEDGEYTEDGFSPDQLEPEHLIGTGYRSAAAAVLLSIATDKTQDPSLRRMAACDLLMYGDRD